MDSNTKKTLYQRAAEIIMDRYKNVKDIPDKYMFFYAHYIPPSIGIKRKFDDSNV